MPSGGDAKRRCKMRSVIRKNLASWYPAMGVKFKGLRLPNPKSYTLLSPAPKMKTPSPYKQTGQSSRNETESPPLLHERFSPLNPDDSTLVAAQKMCSAEADLWPVVDSGRLIGLVCERHPDYRAAGFGHDPASICIRDIMSRELIFCTKDQDQTGIQRLMAEKGLRLLPVVDSAMQIIGFVTRDESEECQMQPTA
jgi:predicted transcriptional regulator